MADNTVILRLEVQGFGDAKQDLEFLTTETAKLAESKKQLATESRNAARVLTAEEGSIEKLRAQTSLMRQEAMRMKATTQEEIKQRDLYIKKIGENEAKIRDFNRSMSGGTTLVGEYEKGFTKAFQNIGKSIAIAGGVIAGIYGAFKTLSEVLKSTGATADEFEATIEGIRQGFEQVKRSVATLDFKDFVSNVKSAIEEGRRYAEGLDDIDDKTRALKIAEAETSNEILKQREMQNSALSTLDQKIAAGKEIIAQEEKLQSIRIGIANQAYKNELDNITAIAFGAENVNDATREQINLYVRRDEAFLKSLEPAKQFRDYQTQINQLIKEETQSISAETGQKAIDNSSKIASIRALITQEMIKANQLMTAVTLPTDEKYNVLVERTVELEQAKGSALDNTLKIRTKLSNAESQSEKASEKRVERYTVEAGALRDLADAALALIDPFETLSQADLSQIPEQVKLSADFVEKYKTEAQEKANKQKVENAKNADEAEIESTKKAEEIKKEAKLAALDGLQAASDAILANKKNALNEEMNAELSKENLTEKQKVEIRKKYAKEQQKVDIKQALINGILSIAKTFATLGWPAGIIPAALAAAQTVIQVAAIKAQKFAKGGKIIGGAMIAPDKSGDNTLVVAKQGEVILNSHQQAAIGGASTFKKLGVPGFASGGVVGEVAQSPGIAFDMNSMIDKMIAGFNNKQVQLVMSDLQKAENNYTLITTANPL